MINLNLELINSPRLKAKLRAGQSAVGARRSLHITCAEGAPRGSKVPLTRAQRSRRVG